MESTPNSPAGWYYESNGSEWMRWWDGSSWSQERRRGELESAASAGLDGLITNWAGIFWLRKKSAAILCPVGVGLVSEGRFSFTTSNEVIFDFPVAEGTYEVGSKMSANPLIVKRGPEKFVLLGALSQGKSPTREMVEFVERTRDQAVTNTRMTFGLMGVTGAGMVLGLALGVPGLMGAGAMAGIAKNLSMGPKEVGAICKVLSNNGAEVNTARLRNN